LLSGVARNFSFAFVFSILVKTVTNPCLFGASAVVEDGEGRVLLVRHSYMSGWQLPGGGVAAGEPPEKAVMRELEEEIGLMECAPPEFVALYSRRILWVGNFIALYRLRNARIAFRPNFEVREAEFFALDALPENATAATRQRLAELSGKAPRSLYW
jgi:ADP-ribose pyrophosphatase YjhB (NUDIX family)